MYYKSAEHPTKPLCFSKYIMFQQPRIKSRNLPLFFQYEKNSELHFNTKGSSKISKSLLSMPNQYLLRKKDERSRRIGIALKANTHPPLREVKQKAPKLTRLLQAPCAQLIPAMQLLPTKHIRCENFKD